MRGQASLAESRGLGKALQETYKPPHAVLDAKGQLALC